LPYQQHHRH